MVPDLRLDAPAPPAALARDGFLRLDAAALRGLVPAAAWDAFAASWDDLRPDPHMADGGRYRLRRHAAFADRPGRAPERLPHRPHWQSLAHNPLNGGVERWFEPVADAVAAGAALGALLAVGSAAAEALDPGAPRLVEVHQFRILADPGAEGRPTPEGLHRDGVDVALMVLVGREGVAGGETVVVDDAGAALARFTLAEPGEGMLVADRRVRHGVSPIRPVAPGRPGRRDVLVATWVRDPALAPP